MLKIGGIRILQTGKENIPGEGDYVIISNHQSSLDIPLMLAAFPHRVSFISKKEVLFLPFFNIWFFALGCLSIDRAKPMAARRKISDFLKRRIHNPVLLFPEGTRSKGPHTRKFKTGGLSHVYKQKKKVLPVHIGGSFKLYEQPGHISPGEVEINIFESVKPEDFPSFNEFVSFLEKKLA